MKCIIVCFLALAAVALARPDEKYTDKYDNLDLDAILGNDKLLAAHFKCIMDQGKCTSEGKELKAHIKEALETKCAKCTDKQAEGIKKVIRHLYKNEPEYWQQLRQKFDPENKFMEEYEKEFKEVTA